MKLNDKDRQFLALQASSEKNINQRHFIEVNTDDMVEGLGEDWFSKLEVARISHLASAQGNIKILKDSELRSVISKIATGPSFFERN